MDGVSDRHQIQKKLKLIFYGLSDKLRESNQKRMPSIFVAAHHNSVFLSIISVLLISHVLLLITLMSLMAQLFHSVECLRLKGV